MDQYQALGREIRDMSALSIVTEIRLKDPDLLSNTKELMKTVKALYPNANIESVMRMARKYKNSATKEEQRIKIGCSWMKIPGINC